MGRYEYIFLYFFRYTWHEIVPILEDEEVSPAIFIKTELCCASNEDFANDDDGGLINNFPVSQLNAPAKALLSDGRQITICQTDQSNNSINAEQIYK